MQDFRKLKVWEKAHRFTVAIYQITKAFPSEERFGLTDQMRRGAWSIPSNIAEGCGRGSNKDFARFLQMSMGSACELEYFILFAKDVELLSEQQSEQLTSNIQEIKRMLASLMQAVRTQE